MADARPTLSIWRSDIRKRKQTQFSRPMTGHTPQKLPRFRAISCIIAVHAQNSPTRARLSYHPFTDLSSTISEKITKISKYFWHFRRFFLLRELPEVQCPWDVNDRLAASRRSQFAPKLLLVVSALLCPVSILRWFSIGF